MQDKQQFIKFPEQHGYDKIKEDLVFTVLEKTLVNARIYHKVLSQLGKKYNCDLHECYIHPEYLSETLKDQNDNSYNSIIRSINQQLEIFSNAESITRFLQAINL
jgi:hypothetical protein